MSIKVELGFTELGVGAPFFTIGDATKGIIGGSFVIGGGEGFVDVTDYLQSVTIRRGKSRELDRFDAGQATATFVNNTRAFDPTYESSPFYGQIVPRRSIRISVNDIIQFTGITDDWNIDYSPSGASFASCIAFDGQASLSGQVLTEYFPDEQLSGARVEAVLDAISWPDALRDIDAGAETLIDDAVSDGTSVVDYLTLVERSETGLLFMSKAGLLTFVDRVSGYAESGVILADDGSGIDYQNVNVVYGSELLYNKVALTGTAASVTAEDATSQAIYGVRELNQTTLVSTEEAMQGIADSLISKYKEPEYRFDTIEVNLEQASVAEKEDLLDLELGSVVQVKFTPSGIPPQISRYGRIIAIQQRHEPTQSIIAFGLESLDGAPFIIGSSAFGIIGEGVIGF